MKLSQQIVEKIKRKAQKYFDGASGCHDWTHVQRVHDLALNIGKKEKADLLILETACYLHDIGRRDEMKSHGKFCHAEAGAKLARRMLEGCAIDQKIIDNIEHCIISHRYRNEFVPKTIEAKVLFDADKLDSIGAVGIGRDFLFAGFLKNPLYTGNEIKLIRLGGDAAYTKDDTAIHEYEFKLKKIKTKMLTRMGKKIAKGRHEFMVKFFKKFFREVDGIE